ncbi:hypothetical protein SCP_0705950 [Sparassis crispa]|uniref:Uncharacterized protein n=1 Tax=Sparassis crispa TaxID=139825 RepID=A0A401GT44_9APHY|nr:hypothetical protein SCP_0705950 [Sparassis crispa]GBE85408.1 hypothetical protein SCP_0705950 [Sparassis crispa]
MLVKIQGLTKMQQLKALETLSKYVDSQVEQLRQSQMSISGPMGPALQMTTDTRANHQTPGGTELHNQGIAKCNRSIECALEEQPQPQHAPHLTLCDEVEMWEQMEHLIPDDQLLVEPATPTQQIGPMQKSAEYQTNGDVSLMTPSPLSQSDDSFLPSSPTEECMQRDPHRLIPHQPKTPLESISTLTSTQIPNTVPAPNAPTVVPMRNALRAMAEKVDMSHPCTGRFLNALKDSTHADLISQITAANQQPVQPEAEADGNTQNDASRTDLIAQIAALAQHQTQLQATATPNTPALTLMPTPAEGFPDIYSHQPYFFIDNLTRDLLDTWSKHDMARIAIMLLGSSVNDQILQPYLTMKIARALERAHQIPKVMMMSPRPLYDSKLINDTPYSFIAFNMMKSQKKDIVTQYCYLTPEVSFIAMDFIWKVPQYVCTFAGFTNHSFQDIPKLILNCLVNLQSIQHFLSVVGYDA